MKFTLLSFFLFPFTVDAESLSAKLPKAYDPPAISLQQAVKKAEQCLKNKKATITNQYLQSAVFEYAVLLEPKAGFPDHGRYWTVTWKLSGFVKGGDVFVRIFEDSYCAVTHGE